MLTKENGGIDFWRFASAVSQLSFELDTGRNWYGKTSVYKGIRLNFIPGLPARATVRNKLVALGCMLDAVPADKRADGGTFNKAEKVLAAKLEELGLELNRAQ